jgi:hypothetical protein
VVTGATLRDHLVGIHMMLANFIATGVAENLPAAHPVRRFLRPFTYRTLSINKGKRRGGRMEEEGRREREEIFEAITYTSNKGRGEDGGGKEGRREGGKEGRREGGKKGRRERGKEGTREGRRREGGKERRRAGARGG